MLPIPLPCCRVRDANIDLIPSLQIHLPCTCRQTDTDVPTTTTQSPTLTSPRRRSQNHHRASVLPPILLGESSHPMKCGRAPPWRHMFSGAGLVGGTRV
ncbi:uncharacterized protein M6B38_341420 [Iris pallida]|uniref:Uncharacterized protein n=1 Tax=Iris pallida TaxID=29817 RepID=A0AAX6GXG5_IRIPA|nr:uncharacterized protein M6B38_341420 [Iris pallida]